jgi:glucose/arabinose dehydrogenase
MPLSRAFINDGNRVVAMKPFSIAALCLAAAMAAPALPQAAPGQWKMEVVTSDLDYPWSLQRSGATLIATEAAGNLVMIDDGRTRRFRLETTVAVAREGGSGLLGLALAPDFARSGTAYLYHTYRDGSRLANRVIEARFDGRAWRETRVLLQGIPGHTLYNGGRVALGPDAHLYVTTGWVRDAGAAQDLRNLAGKVLRIRLDGGIPADNPIRGSYVYSYGHRNPQGLAWSEDGRLFVAEHGESGRDEVNLIVAGGNYGWPDEVGSPARAGVRAPLVDSGRSTWAPSGIAFHQNRLLVTALAARTLLAYRPGSSALEPVFSSGDRLRDVLPVREELYLITTNTSPRAARSAGGDRLLRLTPIR